MKTLFTFLLSVIVFNSIAQVTPKVKEKKPAQDDVYFTPEQKPVKQNQAGDLRTWSDQADKNQVDHIIICLNNYHNERMTAYVIGILGVGIASCAPLAGKDATGAMVAIGGGAVLVSAILFIHAERLISRKNLTFNGNSLTLKF